MGKFNGIANAIFISESGPGLCNDASHVWHNGVSGLNRRKYSVDSKEAETGSGIGQYYYHYRNDRYTGLSDFLEPRFFTPAKLTDNQFIITQENPE